jgi:DNA primase
MKEVSGTTKYMVKATIAASGVVERPDVVGAVFGQTEGLLGNSLDLRELQKTGRIGRIKVQVKSEQGKSTGTITIPSSLDKAQTALIAAALETIDRVGPCEAKIEVGGIQDVRESKRRFIVDRARQILEGFEGAAPEAEKLSKLMEGFERVEKIESYKGLPAGPAMRESDAIIVVEGRADVLNLLRHGIRNTVAVGGTSVPKDIGELSKRKTTTAFLDGDRGGDLILKELMQVADINYVARAPEGKVVEKLEKEEIIEALKNKVPIDKAAADLRRKGRETREMRGKDELRKLEATVGRLIGTSKAYLLDKGLEKIDEVQVRELAEKLGHVENARAVVFDGVISQRLANLAAQKGIRYLVGVRESVEEKPSGIQIITAEEIRKLAR